MRIVVFGATGMVGQRIAAELESRGQNVVSAEEFAIAVADLLESGEHPRERVTAAW